MLSDILLENLTFHYYSNTNIKLVIIRKCLHMLKTFLLHSLKLACSVSLRQLGMSDIINLK